MKSQRLTKSLSELGQSEVAIAVDVQLVKDDLQLVRSDGQLVTEPLHVPLGDEPLTVTQFKPLQLVLSSSYFLISVKPVYILI